MARLFKGRPKLRKIRGYWYAVFYDRETRRRRAFSLGTRYDDVASKRFAKLCISYEDGDFEPFQGGGYEYRSLTVSEAVKRFNAENERRAKKDELSETTVRDYRAFLKMLVASVPADLLLRHVEARHVEDFIFAPKIRMVKGRGREIVGERSDRSHEGYYRRLNRFFRWCLANHLISRSPMEGITKPTTGRGAPDFLRRHEAEALLVAVERDYSTKLALGQAAAGEIIWIADVIRLAIATGLRPSELARLRWIDVDLRNGFLYVRSGIQHRGRRTRTKNRHDRTVPIFPDARAVLERLSGSRTNENAAETVLLSPAGRPISIDKASRKIKRYMRAAGLPETYDYYTLRHTFASWLRLSGVSLDRIKEWLGHATIEQTLVYAHIVPEEVRAEGDPVFPVLFS